MSERSAFWLTVLLMVLFSLTVVVVAIYVTVQECAKVGACKRCPHVEGGTGDVPGQK